VVPPGDPGALGEALRALLDDSMQRAQLGANARAAVAAYSHEAAADAFGAALRAVGVTG
jgi:glycosyltransferase involved in cell wall biosynthesis